MFMYKNLINDLNWNYSDEVQSKAIEELSKLSVAEIKNIILPNGKEHWHNAAIVIYNIISKNKNLIQKEEDELSHLMEWTQDLNWPGSLTIVDSLSLLDEDLVAKLIKNTLKIAQNEGDEDWIDSLKYIAEKLGYNKER
ncbi:hypothetical protein Curi_c27380 [Gottschalkia acidurici 9a]|uniref:DUF5071 domain-containing protein n=1 Tax=Gottschalkia acidurici (strain ATCC 7906 / DSM 604 / BCRC 14475 / CIP 104303 / KCTC 5404 / NCIMB 10678 / 9a) TaxID=1128398 RepID=K0B5B0_GOTA9|nr:DUF5071 domain-containing protein [Gottschalkia acidurici]AFS79731.1 hypothetical protein Curi_c27380 [Gottschalkia acidurici 9a]